MTAVLFASALALAGCDSSDDGSDGGGSTTGPDMPPTGGMQGELSGDIFAIAGRGDADEPARLDRAALVTQLDGLLGVGGDGMEPLVIEDGDDVVTALRRREGGGS